MAKNPNPTGSGKEEASSTLPTAEKAENSAPSQDLGDTRTNAGSELQTDANSKLKPGAAAAAAALAPHQSQVTADSASSKMRKLEMCPAPVTAQKVDLKCLLLADTTLECVPLHLRQLLLHFNAPNLTQAELLLLLIYCVALESGFATQSDTARCADALVRLAPTSSFHVRNLIHLTRVPPTYTANDYKTHLMMQLQNLVRSSAAGASPPPSLLNALLTCLVTGDYLIVTLTPARSRSMPGRSVCLSIARYVLNVQPRGKPVHQRFRKLGELSTLLRQHLFLPVRNRQLDALEISIYPSLLGLPAELYEAIFRHLSANQLKIVANVCKHLHFFSTHSKYFVK